MGKQQFFAVFSKHSFAHLYGSCSKPSTYMCMKSVVANEMCFYAISK